MPPLQVYAFYRDAHFRSAAAFALFRFAHAPSLPLALGALPHAAIPWRFAQALFHARVAPFPTLFALSGAFSQAPFALFSVPSRVFPSRVPARALVSL